MLLKPYMNLLCGLVVSAVLVGCTKSLPADRVDVVVPYTFYVTEMTDGRESHATLLSSLKYDDAFTYKDTRVSKRITDALNLDLFAYEDAHIRMHLVDFASVRGPSQFTLSYVWEIEVRRAQSGEVMLKDEFICREDGRESFQAISGLQDVAEGRVPEGQDEKTWNQLEKRCMMGIANRIAVGVLAWHNAKLMEK